MRAQLLYRGKQQESGHSTHHYRIGGRHLFAFKPHATQHLARFTQEILREDAPLSPGFRELIAARTSGRNDCPF